ncbi:class I SAM-dependent methyltransferase [Arthrobacter crusticola]|uniref:Class I SAM-dependent methyltransferase n=1 Tax=Arthrobacter crusticola TaxID=2547960 RepID=A0A4R5U3C7_9MICC|nr:class I SAM-dependent methyltransferase [Arthrobacter crusticola]TDK28113.1 class I SAM-dependent methyltransferase [Arthrobacter crusticola]
MADYDPRLVRLYDADNPGGPDHDFFRSLADEVGARTIVDLGCGTGLLTVALAAPARTVTGIDPSASMLALARSRPGAERVTWRVGDSAAIGAAQADLVVMSGNTAQHIIGEAWHRALADIYRGLRPGGSLAFERRNPAAREWENWTRDKSYSTRQTAVGELVEWYEVTSVGETGDVSFTSHNLLTAPGQQVPEAITEHATLAFHGIDEVTADVGAAGLEPVGTWGGWRRQPMTATSPLMVFHARRPVDGIRGTVNRRCPG